MRLRRLGRRCRRRSWRRRLPTSWRRRSAGRGDANRPARLRNTGRMAKRRGAIPGALPYPAPAGSGKRALESEAGTIAAQRGAYLSGGQDALILAEGRSYGRLRCAVGATAKCVWRRALFHRHDLVRAERFRLRRAFRRAGTSRQAAASRWRQGGWHWEGGSFPVGWVVGD